MYVAAACSNDVLQFVLLYVRVDILRPVPIAATVQPLVRIGVESPDFMA